MNETRIKDVIIYFLRTYKVEVGFFCAAVVGAIIGVMSLVQSAETVLRTEVVDEATSSAAVSGDLSEADYVEDPSLADQAAENNEDTFVYVDVSGAVAVPGLYRLDDDARLQHAIDSAGGLASYADRDFFFRNYNLSRKVVDQEKIYVPRTDEVENGVFIEGVYTIEHSLTRDDSELADSNSAGSGSSSAGSSSGDSDAISLNNATQSELEELPGVGPVTAEKIMSARPFNSVQKLLDEKIVSKSVFDDIVDSIQL